MKVFKELFRMLWLQQVSSAAGTILIGKKKLFIAWMIDYLN
jgi:hypothetical protein